MLKIIAIANILVIFITAISFIVFLSPQIVWNVRMKNFKRKFTANFQSIYLAEWHASFTNPQPSAGFARCGYARRAWKTRVWRSFWSTLYLKVPAKRKGMAFWTAWRMWVATSTLTPTRKETVIYSADRAFRRAFELVDIVFHSTFPQREVRERGDYRQEIQSYEDNPSRANLRWFLRDLIFGASLGRNILAIEQLKQVSAVRMLPHSLPASTIPTIWFFFVLGNLRFQKESCACGKAASGG